MVPGHRYGRVWMIIIDGNRIAFQCTDVDTDVFFPLWTSGVGVKFSLDRSWKNSLDRKTQSDLSWEQISENAAHRMGWMRGIQNRVWVSDSGFCGRPVILSLAKVLLSLIHEFYWEQNTFELMICMYNSDMLYVADYGVFSRFICLQRQATWLPVDEKRWWKGVTEPWLSFPPWCYHLWGLKWSF